MLIKLLNTFLVIITISLINITNSNAAELSIFAS